MPVPKSVVKINKDGVHYTSSVDRTAYTIEELTRGALKDVGKLLRTKAKKAAPKDSGDYRKNIATWVRKDRRTGDVELQFGVYTGAQSRKKNKNPSSYYAHIIEFGSRYVRKLGILKGTTMDNLDEIQRIEGEYLSAIEDENKALRLIDEKEEVRDD